MPTRRKRKAHRSSPKQVRSRETVNAILEATVQVLDREGADAATTSRIAEVAGVSIGTLYQYFENRGAILDALQEQEFERATAFMERVLLEGAGLGEYELSRKVFRGLVALYARSPALHRVLVVEGLRVTPKDRVMAFDTRVAGLLRGFLATSHLPIRRQNLEAAAFVIYQSVRATMLSRLLWSPPGLDDDTLIEELTDLVVRYLIAEPAASRMISRVGGNASRAMR